MHPTRKDQTAEDLLWIREPFLDHYRGSELVVVGHTPTQLIGGHDMERNTPLFLENNIIACDTGSFLPGGRISCVDVGRYLDLRCAGRDSAPHRRSLPRVMCSRREFLKEIRGLGIHKGNIYVE